MKPHHTTNHASTTTPHRVSMPAALLFWRRIDSMPDVLLSSPPGSQGTSRSPGVVLFNVVDTPLHRLSRGIVPRSHSPSSGNAPCMCLPFRSGVLTTHPPSSGGAFGLSIHLPPWGGASALLMRLPPWDGASCMCPVAVGSNASSFVAAAFSALLAGSMLEVPLARAGAVPTAGTLRLCACGSAAPQSGMSTPGGRLPSHLRPRSQPCPPSFVHVNARGVDFPCIRVDAVWVCQKIPACHTLTWLNGLSVSRNRTRGSVYKQ